VVAANPSQLIITREPPSQVIAGKAFTFRVTVEDPYNNVVTTYPGSVTVELASNPGTGSLGGTVTVTPTRGVATFSDLLLDTAGNGYSLEATTNGTPAITSLASTSFNVRPADASQFYLKTPPPGTITAGDRFGLTVWAEDAYGNLVTSYIGKVTVALEDNPGGGTLGGRLSVTARHGVATFENLVLKVAADGYTLQVTAKKLTPITTAPFDVIPAAASQLVVTTQPPGTVDVNQTFGFTVAEEDAYGNVENTFQGNVTVSLRNNPTGANLGGTLTVNAQNGVATFTDLTLDKPGDGYTLQAATSGVSSATTRHFKVVTGSTPGIVITPSITAASNLSVAALSPLVGGAALAPLVDNPAPVVDSAPTSTAGAVSPSAPVVGSISARSQAGGRPAHPLIRTGVSPKGPIDRFAHRAHVARMSRAHRASSAERAGMGGRS
jgi:hypothetical protein